MADKKAIVDEKVVRDQLKQVIAAIDTLTPHVNKANSAFGGLDDHAKQLKDLKDQAQRALTAYGG